MFDTIAFKRLTPGQRHALRTDGFGLINAVAGSGKTTQLVALTIKTLLENQDQGMDQLAIITFTRKAGAELRDRLRQAMEVEWHHDLQRGHPRAALWEKWLAQLPGAAIGTTDALVQQILRRFALDRPGILSLDPSFSVQDETATAVVIRRAVHQVLERPDAVLAKSLDHVHRQHERRSIETICVRFLTAGGDGEKACQAISSLHADPRYSGVNSHEFGLLVSPRVTEWENRWAEMEQTIPNLLNIGAAELAGRKTEAAADIRNLAASYRLDAGTPRSRFQELRKCLFTGNGQSRIQGLGNADNPYSPTIADLQSRLAPLVELQKGAPKFDPAQPLVDPEPVRQWRQAWGCLLQAVDRRFAALCQRENSYPFFLLGRMLLKVLQESDKAIMKALGIEYTRLMVDEFQDNTQQQWEIACRLSGGDPANPGSWGRLTLVGDPEQAIYHWRGSNPRLMEQVRADYLKARPAPRPTWYDAFCTDFRHRESTEWEKVGLGQLNQNYRTAPATLELIDRASSFGMAHLGLGHVPLESGEPDLSNPETAEKIARRNSQSIVKLLLPPNPETPSPENDEVESPSGESQTKADRFNAHSLRMLAAHLRAMHTRHGVAWKDMLVLAHSFKTLLDPLQEALAAEGIPCRALVRDAVWRRQEVADLVNLIRFLADPSDTPALLGVLLGPVARLTPSEITLLGVLCVSGDTVRPNLEAGLRALADPEAPAPFIPMGVKAKTAWDSLAQHRRDHLQNTARRLVGASGWRALVDRMPHHQLVRHVLQESGAWLAIAAWNARPGASPESFDRSARGIDHALGRMEELESGSPLSLREMAETLTGLMEGEIAEKVDAELGPGEDLVRIMTVHVSKGLEARVVGLLVPSVGERGNRMPLGSNMVILDRQYFQAFNPDRHGPLLGLPLFKYPDHLVDGQNQFTDEIEGQTLLALASHADQVLQAQESVRLFHVAITRSEAGLFVAGSCPAANPESYRLWPQWFCEGSWPASCRDSDLPPEPQQAAGEKPVCHAGPNPILPRIERPASLSVKRAEGFVTGQDDNAQALELAHLGLQPRVRPIPADWVSGNVLRARRDTPGSVVGTLVHRGFEMGETLPAGHDRKRFLTNMASALLRECRARDLESGESDNSSGGADLLAGQVASTAEKILSILDRDEGKEFLELLRTPGSAETDFSLRLGNWLIKGRLDRLLEDGTIIDWKTDEEPVEGIVSRYHNQMALYALALWTARGRTEYPVRVKLAMTHHATVVPLEFTPAELRGFEATLRNRLDRARALAESAPA